MPYKFNGKELDEETGLYYYVARYMQPMASIWYGVDPLAEKYASVSGYTYCLGNPIILFDSDGRRPRIYIETNGVGHTFVTTGKGKNTVVYTYGRYGMLGKDKSSARGTTPSGEGVLIIMTGKEAQSYINKEIEKNAAIFEFTKVSDKKVNEYFEKQFEKSKKIPTTGKYANHDNARVIDEYDLASNNCTTKSIEAIEAGGGDTYYYAGDVAPLQLAKHLTDEIIIDKIKSVFTKERTIVNIKPTTIINEFNNEK